jgi:hypothetical protein
MRRAFFSAVTVFVAAAALTLSSPAAFAQQEHDHGTPSGGEKSCACCRMSGNGAMNHGTAAQAQPPAPSGAVEEKAPADAVDHAAMGHVPPPQAAVEPKAQERAAGHSCGMMAAKEGNDSAGGCACCASMAKMSAHADGKAAGGCAMCASKMAAKAPAADAGSPDASTFAMPGGSSCGKTVTASTAADPLAEDSSVSEQ